MLRKDKTDIQDPVQVAGDLEDRILRCLRHEFEYLDTMSRATTWEAMLVLELALPAESDGAQNRRIEPRVQRQESVSSEAEQMHNDNLTGAVERDQQDPWRKNDTIQRPPLGNQVHQIHARIVSLPLVQMISTLTDVLIDAQSTREVAGRRLTSRLAADLRYRASYRRPHAPVSPYLICNFMSDYTNRTSLDSVSGLRMLVSDTKICISAAESFEERTFYESTTQEEYLLKIEKKMKEITDRRQQAARAT